MGVWGFSSSKIFAKINSEKGHFGAILKSSGKKAKKGFSQKLGK